MATGKVTHIFRHFPLDDIHPNARAASIAGICAGQQKPAWFWQMHDWLFANQTSWASAQGSAALFRTQALSLGVDASKYDACVADSKTKDLIEKDIAAGAQRGIQGTPAFYVNDWFINGAQAVDVFRSTIDKAVQGQRPAPTPTPLPSGAAPYDVDPARPGYTYDNSPTTGQANALVVLVQFIDFGSPEVVQHVKTVEPQLRVKYVNNGTMRIVTKFYPLAAPKAALASICARDQGKFWGYYEQLFAHSGEWTDGDQAAFTNYAKPPGLMKPSSRAVTREGLRRHISIKMSKSPASSACSARLTSC